MITLLNQPIEKLMTKVKGHVVLPDDPNFRDGCQESPQDIGPDSASNGIETGLFLHSQCNLETAPDL